MQFLLIEGKFAQFWTKNQLLTICYTASPDCNNEERLTKHSIQKSFSQHHYKNGEAFPEFISTIWILLITRFV